MRAHQLYVQMIAGNDGTIAGWFAVCMICGCDPFPNRRERVAAEADAKEHGILVERGR